jgi:ribose transport system substrate-binding protein
MKGRTKLFTLVVSLVFIFMVIFSAGSVCAEDQTYAMVVFLKGSEFFNWAYGGMQDAAKLLGADIKTELRGPATWDASQEARAIEQLIATPPL